MITASRRADGFVASFTSPCHSLTAALLQVATHCLPGYRCCVHRLDPAPCWTAHTATIAAHTPPPSLAHASSASRTPTSTASYTRFFTPTCSTSLGCHLCAAYCGYCSGLPLHPARTLLPRHLAQSPAGCVLHAPRFGAHFCAGIGSCISQFVHYALPHAIAPQLFRATHYPQCGFFSGLPRAGYLSGSVRARGFSCCARRFHPARAWHDRRSLHSHTTHLYTHFSRFLSAHLCGLGIRTYAHFCIYYDSAASPKTLCADSLPHFATRIHAHPPRSTCRTASAFYRLRSFLSRARYLLPLAYSLCAHRRAQVLWDGMPLLYRRRHSRCARSTRLHSTATDRNLMPTRTWYIFRSSLQFTHVFSGFFPSGHDFLWDLSSHHSSLRLPGPPAPASADHLTVRTVTGYLPRHRDSTFSALRCTSPHGSGSAHAPHRTALLRTSPQDHWMDILHCAYAPLRMHRTPPFSVRFSSLHAATASFAPLVLHLFLHC